MKIVVPKEACPRETRVALVPTAAKKLVQKGAQIQIESGIGKNIGCSDRDYNQAGATICTDRQSMLASADVVLRLHKPTIEEVKCLRRGTLHVSFLDPFRETDLLNTLAQQGVSTICMEMVPRVTRAQKMDALSSQANLAGYVAVILAAQALNRILPMMTTAAGTLSPARFFVIGAGVAGLQVIATAKRLGAQVEVYDVRPAVEEEVSSLGVKFIRLEQDESESGKGAYAQQLTSRQLVNQQEKIDKHCSQADVVVTTARIFGKKSPLIVTRDMIAKMKKGSVIVDLAVEDGGNVEGSKLNKVIDQDGVTILGHGDLATKVPFDASHMYANNVTNFIEEYWDDQSKSVNLNLRDEILEGCLITYQGKICNQMLLDHIETLKGGRDGL